MAQPRCGSFGRSHYDIASAPHLPCTAAAACVVWRAAAWASGAAAVPLNRTKETLQVWRCLHFAVLALSQRDCPMHWRLAYAYARALNRIPRNARLPTPLARDLERIRRDVRRTLVIESSSTRTMRASPHTLAARIDAIYRRISQEV